MRTWTADAWLAGPPEEVLELLTEPAAIAAWSPVGFDIVESEGERLVAGSRTRVRGELTGRSLEFDVHVHEASTDRLALVADGPVRFEVEYRLQPLDCGSEVRAAVSVSGRGLFGGLMARAVEALLAGGVLQLAVARLSDRVELASV